MKTAQQTQHTPGPWSADKWAPGITVSAPNSHYSVCHLEDCNNAEANARLIAAAPELLEALKIGIDCHDSNAAITGKYKGSQQLCQCRFCIAARAVIAKATGQ